jgi:hypothetical protein
MGTVLPKSMSAIGGRRARQRIAELKERRIELLRDLVAIGRPKTPAEHSACGAISRELQSIQAELNRLEGEHGHD